MSDRATPGQPWIIDAAIYVHLAYQAEVSESKRNDGPMIATHDPGVSTTGIRLASMIRDLVDRFGFDTAVAAWNGPSDRQWRPRFAPTYKSNRTAKAPGLCELLDAAPGIFANLGIRSFALDEYEADDVIASACYRHAGCVIVSNDKDFYQVLGVNGARIWDPRKRRDTAPKGAIGLTPDAGPAGAWITLEDVVAKFGVPPELVIDVQAIMGDTADGIPGAHGVGAKGAATLIGTYGDLDAVLGADPACVNGGVAKLLRLVHDARDKVEQARRLVTLATDLDVPVYPVAPPAVRGIGAFLNPRNLESPPVSSPFAKILGTPAPAASAPSLKDRLNAEASTAAGAPTPPAPSAPARTPRDGTAAACATSARQYVQHGWTEEQACQAIAPWAANQAADLEGHEVARIVRDVYAAAGKASPPAPAAPPPAPVAPPAPPSPAQHYPTDIAGANVVRGMLRNNAGAAVRAGKAIASAIAEARAFNDARPADVRLNDGEVDQIVAGVYASGTAPRGPVEVIAQPAPPAPAAPPAPPVSINPPDGIPSHAPATEYAPGGALDPSRKAPKEDTIVPAGFGSWSGKTWTSIVKDDAALFQIELRKLVAAAEQAKYARYNGASTCPAKGAKRSDLLADCKLLVAVLTGAALPAVEAEDAPPAPPVNVATIPEPQAPPAPPAPPAFAEPTAEAHRLHPSVPNRPAAPPEVHEDDADEDELDVTAPLLAALFVDCYPTRYNGLIVTLLELVERHGWAREVARDLGVVHHGIAEYRRDARGIAAHLDAFVCAGHLSGMAVVVDTGIDYARECRAVLEPLAGLVVRRIG